jgi:ABC-type polysaccharide/polyol phosphate export permease
MHAYLASIWKCRFFWLSLVKMDLRSRYRGSVLGIGWSLVNPIAMTAILCVVFGHALKVKPYEYAPFLFTGLTFWGFFSASVIQGCHCFFQGESYIRQYPAPMAIYPLRNVLGAAFHFSIGLLLAAAIGLVVGPNEKMSPDATRVNQLMSLPYLLPACLLLLLFGWSLSVLAGLISVRFRDTRHMTEIVLQGLFYVTPVMLPPSLFAERGRMTLLLKCNPLSSFLDLLRDPILYARVPDVTTYAYAVAVTLSFTLAAIVALRIEERRLIFHL